MNKKILSLGLAGTIIFSGVAFADSPVKKEASVVQVATEIEKSPEFQEIKIVDKKIKGETNYEIKVVIPEIKGLKDEKFEKELNEKIEIRIKEDLKAFEEEAKKREADFEKFEEETGKKESEGKAEYIVNYEVKSKGDVISLVVNRYEIYVEDANGQSKTDFYNIDIVNSKLLKLKDIFKEATNYKEVLDKEIKSQIAKESDKYFEGDEGFTTVKDEQGFYIAENGSLVMVFEKYEIAPGSTGSPEFIISLDKVRDILVKEAINEIGISDKEIKMNTLQDISVIIPNISGLSDKGFEKELNEEIESIARKDIEQFEKEVSEGNTTGVSELKVNYEIKSKGEVKSIVISIYKMISGEANGSTRKDYYNIDTKNNKVLELKDLFKDGAKYKDLINKEIKAQIDKDKENYFDDEKAFKSIEDDQDYYLDKTGSIMIEFPMYEIAPRSTGTPVFRISNHILKDILKDEIASKGVQDLEKLNINDKEIRLNNSMYISEKGNLMVPLGEIAKELGYEIEWNSKTKIVNLSKGNVTASVSLKEHQYSYNRALVILEEEAKSVKGVTYVPSKFFERVLKLENVVDELGILNIK